MLALYKGLEFLSKYLLLLILVVLVLASVYLLFMKEIGAATIGFVFTALGYYMYKIIFKQKKK
ncbi:hypothetical protein BAGA_19235 [Bacillus gaemokensis]|uniref:Uncharacterized protein n=1 Tax=Bacillus gaemokensis TaxID=574375 RepID=A0A073K7K2_9BACI|nr:hypothetical protein BAGA_19235 [Bacillus gaemokensis]